jgi:hypothetical protein
MNLEEQISEIFNEIDQNKERGDNTFDYNITKIKLLLKGKLDDNQTTIYLDWCNNILPKAKKQYATAVGGYFIAQEFKSPIFKIVLDIQNKNK